MNTNQDQLAAVFNEWKRRYEESPESFDGIEGDDYGQTCAKFLIEIHEEKFPSIESLIGMKVISDPSLPVGTGEFRSTKTGECVGKISFKP